MDFWKKGFYSSDALGRVSRKERGVFSDRKRRRPAPAREFEISGLLCSFFNGHGWMPSVCIARLPGLESMDGQLLLESIRDTDFHGRGAR